MSRVTKHLEFCLKNNNKIDSTSAIVSINTFKKYRSAVILTTLGGRKPSIAISSPLEEKLVFEMVNKIMQ